VLTAPAGIRKSSGLVKAIP